MAKTDAQKKATAKWDAENMTVVSCKMKRDIAARFAEVAKANGTTRNAVLLQAAKDYIEQHDTKTE